MTKVAVLMSTYNGEKYLEEQIESILNQKGDFKLDLYVRDDGSRDRTLNILKRYEADNKLSWYISNNLGPAKSFYDLLLHSNGYDYYAFSDQDDFWNEDKIQRAINFLENQSKPSLYCSNAELVDSNLDYLGRNVYKVPPKTDFETIVCAGGLLGCTMIFNSKLADVVTSVKKYPDMVMHDFYIATLCAAINGSILYDSKPTMKYRQHGSNVIGVSYGFLGKVIGRVKDIMYKEPIGIAGQSSSILNNYSCCISEKNKKWLLIVSEYRYSIVNRIRLAFSQKTRYSNRNMGIKLRLSILFGNR